MLKLPDNVRAYKKTPVFSHESVPAGLLKDHSTKADTWGVLHVEQGALIYIVTEPGYEEECVISAGSTAIIAPEHKHYVALQEDVSFYIEFYR